MKVEEIHTKHDANKYIEHCLNDFVNGRITKREIMIKFREYTSRIMIIAKRIIKQNPKLLKSLNHEKHQI